MSARSLVKAPLWPLRAAFRTLRWLGLLAYRNQNLLLVLAALGTVSAMAAVSGYWLFYRAAYVLGAPHPSLFLVVAPPPAGPGGNGRTQPGQAPSGARNRG